jgi:hypothetical protein
MTITKITELEQLRLFVGHERAQTGKAHIADWALAEIDRRTDRERNLMAEVERLKADYAKLHDYWEKSEQALYEASINLRFELAAAQVDADSAILNGANMAISNGQLRFELAAAQADVKRMQEFITDISKKTPGRPDYWSSCGQCENNIGKAEDILEAMQGETK